MKLLSAGHHAIKDKQGTILDLFLLLFCEARMSNLMKIENLLATQQKEKQQHVLHAYCDGENSRNVNPSFF